MKFSIVLFVLGVVLVAAPAASAQPTFFSDEASCLTAQPGTFQYYQNHGTTRLLYWKARVAVETATLEPLKRDLCANENSVDPSAPLGHRVGFHIVRLEQGTMAFFIHGIPVADARCGNDFTWAQYVQVIVPPPPPPPPPPAPEVPVRQAPPAPLPVPPPEVCPNCVGIQVEPMDAKGTVLKLTAVMSDGSYVSGKFLTDNGKVIGVGNELLVSAKRLDKLYGKKGEHAITFLGHDAQGRVVACEGIYVKRHGRNWLIRFLEHIPCVRQIIHPKKWKGWDAAEKVGCMAIAAWATYELTAEGIIKVGEIFTRLP